MHQGRGERRLGEFGNAFLRILFVLFLGNGSKSCFAVELNSG